MKTKKVIKITVSTQREWEEMWNTIGPGRPVKIYITEGALSGKYFKDVPPPEIKYAYIDSPSESSTTATDSDNKVQGDLVDNLSVAVPKGLELLFPGGKILPYNLPEWLRDSGAITVLHTNATEVVDLDVNVDKLLAGLHTESLKYIGEEKTNEELMKGKEFLLSILTIKPDNIVAWYNLACAESLMHNTDAAVEALGKSVEFGYMNVDHMEKDSDLNNIRSNEGYINIVKKLRGEEEQQQQQQQTPVQQEQEIKVEEVVKTEVEEVKQVVDEPVKVVEEIKKVEEVIVEPVTPVVEEPVKNVVEEEKKLEEPVVEEKKQPEVVVDNKREEVFKNCRWPEVLKTLENMGYDLSVAAYLLDEYRGDISKVLEYLFQ